VKAKDHSRDTVAGEAGTSFPQTFAKRTGQRHPDGPAVLHARKVAPYCPPILDGERFQLFAYWFIAGGGPEEDERNSIGHDTSTIDGTCTT